MFYKLTMKSGNVKTGPIPVSMTSSDSCSKECPFKVSGCYAKYGMLGMHWRRLDKAGDNWKDFINKVKLIPNGQIWRHNQAGDLPGIGSRINTGQLRELVTANAGKKGFTYTHKPLTKANIKAVTEANDNGFTINISVNRVDEVDEVMHLGLPVCTTLPHDFKGKSTLTKGGTRIVVCPSQVSDTTCEKCKLCQKRNRKSVVGFIAHGTGKNKVSEISRL